MQPGFITDYVSLKVWRKRKELYINSLFFY